MKKKISLDSIRVASPCSEDWERMRGGEKARFCSHCALEVNNLSALTRKEAMRLVRQTEGRICVRYIQNPATNAPVFADRLYQITRRAGIAAGVLGASLTLSTLTYAQGGVSVSPPLKPQVETSKEIQSDKEKTESSTATISGTVTDPNGAVVPNITLTLFNEKTSESRNTTSGEDGFYEFKDVQTGTYRVKAKGIAGLADYEAIGVEARENSTTALDISMQVSSVLSSVTVGGVDIVEYEQTLLSAVSGEDFDEVKHLVARGENVNAKDKNYGGSTALHVAVETGNVEIVKFLLDMGAKMNARDNQRRTPLMAIDYDATPELVRMLLDHRAKINAFDTEGNTALIFAADLENAEILRVLIDAGANVNAPNKQGRTALMMAVDNGELENVLVLLEAGANPNLVDADDETVLTLSRSEEMTELLKSYGGK